jgi:hypothetical protein
VLIELKPSILTKALSVAQCLKQQNMAALINA